MVQIISSRLPFAGRNILDKSDKAKDKSQNPASHKTPNSTQITHDRISLLKDAGLTEEDIVALQDTVDQFKRAVNMPEEAGASSSSQKLGEVFTDEVYQKVNQAMRQVKGQKMKGSFDRATALKELLNQDESLRQRFEISKFTLPTSERKPSLVMLMPKPMSREQFFNLAAGLSLRWLDTELPTGSWLIDADNLKRIYCTSNTSDLAALRQLHASNTAQGKQDLKQAFSNYFVQSGGN